MIDAYQAADSSNNWAVDTYRVDWSRQSGETRGDKEAELLKAQDYRTTKAYDGLDRSRHVTYPEDKNGSRKVLEPTYNKAGSLQAVELDGSTYVDHIAYNPKGQRILAALGCGVMTRYDYDDESMRLVRLRSEGYTKPNSTTYSPDGTTPHQDFSYTYDGVGNVTQIDSSGNNVGIGGTNSLTRTFEYDPLYRLTEATGREYAANPSNPWDYMPAGGNANDPNQTRAYTEEYDYDEVGNMTELIHNYGASSDAWTRDFVTESTTNRLDQMTSAGGTHQYTYDRAGNLRTENTDRKYEWDARGRMRSFRNQVSGSQATVFAHYTYDGGGQRVQKVVSRDSGKPVHSVYIGGIFEHHERIDQGTVDAEVNHLHVMDDQKRGAIERVGSELDGSNPPTTQYHLGDHLQSSNVVLDGTGTLFNREEYRPFGESSFGSYATKRYRFTGQERDEESSLSYHGARYYAPWTAQWTSPDPKGMVDGTNLYGYSRNNPVNRRDKSGTQSGDSKKSESTVPLIQIDPNGVKVLPGTKESNSGKGRADNLKTPNSSNTEPTEQGGPKAEKKETDGLPDEMKDYLESVTNPLYNLEQTWDSVKRKQYESTISRKSFQAELDILGTNDPLTAKQIAKEVSEDRKALRTDMQSRLTPHGRYLSEKIDKSEKSLLDFRADKLRKTRPNLNPNASVETLKKTWLDDVYESALQVAKSAGRTRKLISLTAKAGRVLGPIAAVAGIAVSVLRVTSAPSSERAEIATEEATGTLLGGLGGPAGFALGALAGAAIGGSVAPVIIGMVAGAALGYAAEAGGRAAADYFFE